MILSMTHLLEEKNMMKTTLWHILLIFILFIQPVFGGEPSESKETADTVTMEPVVVKGKRGADAERNVEPIDLKTETPSMVSTLPDVLDKTSGLDIQRRSLMTPKSSQVRIRGFDEKRYVIMTDGRPLNGTGVMGGQFVDWSAIPLKGWETVEVEKGAFSAKVGNTLGGAVKLVSNPPEKETEISLFSGIGEYNTWSLGSAVSGRTEHLGASLYAGYNETDGHLRNSSVERTDASGRFYWFFGGDGEISAGIRYIDGDYEMPVENRASLTGYDASFPESSGTYLIGPGIQFPTGDRHGDGSYYSKQRTELDLGIKKSIGNVRSELKVYYNDEEREDFIYSFLTGEKVMVRDAVPDRSWGWVSKFNANFGAHNAAFGADGNYQGYGGTTNSFILESYFPKAVTDGADDWDGTKYHGVFIDDLWTINEQFEVYAGLRYENFKGDRSVDSVLSYKNGKPAGFGTEIAKIDEDAFSPKLGLTYRPLKDIAFHGRFARAVRFPDNPAFYWYYGGYRPEVDPASDIVRKDLTYEDALQYETGAEYTGFPGWSVSVNYYHYDVDNYLQWIFGYAPSRVVYNIDNVAFDGLETDVQGRVAENVYVFANFTWQKTKKEGDVLDGSNTLTDELSELPELKFNCGLKYERSDGALAKLTLRWVDDRDVPFIGDPGAPYAGESAPDGAAIGKDVILINMDSFVTVDLLFKYPVLQLEGMKGVITAGVQNLFDEIYVEEFDFPSPGRVFHAGVELTF